MEGRPRSRYKYTPLPGTNSIRLLRLNPRTGIGAVLTGSLIVRQLDDLAPRYTSLSYSWGRNSDGDASLNKTLLLDGCELPITENLRDFLVQNSKPYAPPSPLLWVDAVCIDQENVEERGIQVSIMATIYEKASNLIIWLGYGESGEDREVMHALEPFLRFPENHGVPEELDSTESGRIMPKCRASVARLCRRRYFQRRWVIQEIHHSEPIYTTLAWGAFGFDHREFCVGLRRLNYLVGKESPEYGSSGPGRDVQTNEDSIALRNAYDILNLQSHVRALSIHGNRRILECMYAYRHTACSDDRDLLFAFLSFGGMHSSLAADYRLQANEVFFKFAHALVEDGYIKDLLSLTSSQWNASRRHQSTGEGASLPLRVPDFRSSLHAQDPGRSLILQLSGCLYHRGEAAIFGRDRVLTIRAKIGRIVDKQRRDAALTHELEDLKKDDFLLSARQE